MLANCSSTIRVTQVPTVFTVEEVRHRFRASGTSVTAWAQKHGFPRQIVYSLLNGRTQGHRGSAHAAAVALGLKLELDVDELDLPSQLNSARKIPNHGNGGQQEQTMTS